MNVLAVFQFAVLLAIANVRNATSRKRKRMVSRAAINSEKEVEL